MLMPTKVWHVDLNTHAYATRSMIIHSSNKCLIACKRHVKLHSIGNFSTEQCLSNVEFAYVKVHMYMLQSYKFDLDL